MAELIGYILAIDAIVTWSVASLVYKVGLERTDIKGTVLFRLVMVSIATFIFSLLFGSYLFLTTLNAGQMIAYLLSCLISGLSVTIGDLMYFNSLQKIDASRAYPLVQLSLVFVYPFAFFLFGESITPAILIGGILILSSVFLLGSKDKDDKNGEKSSQKSENPEHLISGILLAIGSAFCWAIAIVAFNQARILTGDVFITNFLRVGFATILMAIVGLFQREYYSGYKKENRPILKYFIYIGIAGSLSLGLADSLFYKAAEINGLVLISTITANTPMVQQILSIAILKEKFRKRFIVAIILIIIGNYIILFL